MEFDNTAQLDTMARVNPVIPPKQPWQFKESAWARPYKGLAEGLMQGAAAVTELGTLGKNIALGNEKTPGGVPDYSGVNPLGEQLRRDAHQFRPDPATTGLAENVVHEVFRIVPKAAAYMVAAGPVGGAVALGTDEAMAVDADLAGKGVDEATRHKAAAVAGIGAGVGIVLPLAGPTLKATAALYLAGGPGAFMAQQAATREILAQANYGELAKQYDPLDLSGVLVASAIPLPFTAWGLRNNLRGRVPAKPADASVLPGPPFDSSQVQQTPREFGGSAESKASLEATARLRTDTAAGRVTKVVDADGTTRPLNTVDGVDTQAGRGQTILQRGIGADPNGWVIMSQGEGVSKGAASRAKGIAERAYQLEQEKIATQPPDAVPAGREVGFEEFEAAQRAVTPEVVDAAMVHNVTLQRDIFDATKPSEPTITLDPAPVVRAEPKPAGKPQAKPAPKIPGEAPAATVEVAAPVKLPQLDDHAQAVVQRVAEIEQTDPAVKQRMEAARQEVANGTDADLGTLDADLVRVAADCFLSLGG